MNLYLEETIYDKNERTHQICEYCGTDRQTFYYHFKDKYDLVAWIYQNDLNDSLYQYGNMYCKEQTKTLLNRISEKQFFIEKLLPIRTKEQMFRIKFNSYAWVGCLAEWLADKCEPAPDIYIELLYEASTTYSILETE